MGWRAATAAAARQTPLAGRGKSALLSLSPSISPTSCNSSPRNLRQPNSCSEESRLKSMENRSGLYFWDLPTTPCLLSSGGWLCRGRQDSPGQAVPIAATGCMWGFSSHAVFLRAAWGRLAAAFLCICVWNLKLVYRKKQLALFIADCNAWNSFFTCFTESEKNASKWIRWERGNTTLGYWTRARPYSRAAASPSLSFISDCKPLPATCPWRPSKQEKTSSSYVAAEHKAI